MTAACPTSKATWRAGAYSQLGSARTVNMDALMVCDRCGFCVLADGMGGTPRGGEAAEAAVTGFADRIVAGPRDEDTVHAAVAAAQQAVLGNFLVGGRLTGGSTLCALVAVPGQIVYAVNVGDSRGYLLRAGRLRRLTTDHTVAEHLVSAGVAEPDSPLARRTTHHLRRYLGNSAGTVADLVAVELHPGDEFLLSTDGLHGSLADDELASILRSSSKEGDEPGETARRLVFAAVRAGADDDSTAVVIRPGRPEPT